MSERKVAELFDAWRRGDAPAGGDMAQRFTDWYFAIACVHSGELAGQHTSNDACQRFSQGVSSVPDARRLLPWAVGIVAERVRSRPAIADGDFPGIYTRSQNPKDLLTQVRGSLAEEMAILEAAYINTDGLDPIEVIQARYAVKRWLAQEAGLPFKVLPRQVDPDLAPLPFYESRVMTRPEDLARFELFMLEQPSVCQDITEFAHFAIALRGRIRGAASVADKNRHALRATVSRAGGAPSDTLPPAPQPTAEQPPVDQRKFVVDIQDWRVLAVIIAVTFLAAFFFMLLVAALIF